MGTCNKTGNKTHVSSFLSTESNYYQSKLLKRAELLATHLKCCTIVITKSPKNTWCGWELSEQAGRSHPWFSPSLSVRLQNQSHVFCRHPSSLPDQPSAPGRSASLMSTKCFNHDPPQEKQGKFKSDGQQLVSVFVQENKNTDQQFNHFSKEGSQSAILKNIQNEKLNNRWPQTVSESKFIT